MHSSKYVGDVKSVKTGGRTGSLWMQNMEKKRKYGRTDKPKAISRSTFFKVGGIHTWNSEIMINGPWRQKT